MSLIKSWERGHLQDIADAARTPLPTPHWKTPDGNVWAVPEILQGWGGARPSDRWAWLTLREWLDHGLVVVRYVELPEPLRRHKPEDPAWAFIDKQYGPGDLEPETICLGRADLHCRPRADGPSIMVEFGTCAPLKFTFNVGTNGPRTHWMLSRIIRSTLSCSSPERCSLACRNFKVF